MKVRSIKGRTAEEIKNAFNKNTADGFGPTLAIVFIADDNEREAVTKLLSEKNFKIFGASTGSNNNIKSIWNAPLAGFFCYGEIGKVVSGEHEFHNMTCSLAILKEK